MNFRIVSGYTKHTPYEQEIIYLTESLKKNNVTNYDIVPYDNLGNWTLNCQVKAEIIYNQLKKYNIPIVWLDADSVLYDYPYLFENINLNIAFCDYYHGLHAGVLYLKPTEQILNLCEEWMLLNNKTGINAVLGDQKNLALLIDKYKIPYYKLPVSYAKIDFAECKDKIIIGQNQASRRFKKIINQTSL